MITSKKIDLNLVRQLALLLFVLALAVGTCTGQGAASENNQVKNAGGKISLAKNVNEKARSTPMNATINSAFAELKPVSAANGRRLYFSRSFHPNNSNGVKDPEDIWFTDYDSSSNEWGEPARLFGILNNAGPNFIQSVSVTGDTIILGNRYKKNGSMQNGVSYSVNTHGEWSAPIAIPIKNDYNISMHENRFVDLKTGVIISSVNRADSHGERDLYVSFWNGGYASEPINMGTILNTEFEESSPFLADDNVTLYFASKGHHGLGGFDIYVTERLDDSWLNWSKPRNLGRAVNGTNDDEFFTITHCGRYAMFSKQISVHNHDLYKISMSDLFGPSELKPAIKQESESRPVFFANL